MILNGNGAFGYVCLFILLIALYFCADKDSFCGGSELQCHLLSCVAVRMGTELMRVCVKEENDDIPSIPPGFESYASFTLKRGAQDTEKLESDTVMCCSASTSNSDTSPVQKETELGNSESTKITRSLRRRPWINYGRYDNSLQDEPDCGKLDQVSFFCSC